eukprot:gene9353-10335_t
MTSRGGMLFHVDDENVWKSRLDKYNEVLKEKSRAPKKKELLELDDWYQKQLPKCLAERSPRYLLKEELIKIMKWKLMRGKFRPRLTELVQQNSEEGVKEISKRSFNFADDVQQAVKEMSKLKAVGPATASAILCASNPDIYPFMADEAMSGVPGFSIDYTINNYIKFQREMARKSDALSQASRQWTPHEVELALWAEVTAGKLGMDLTCSKYEDTTKKKRKFADSSANVAKKQTKKRKTTK